MQQGLHLTTLPGSGSGLALAVVLAVALVALVVLVALVALLALLVLVVLLVLASVLNRARARGFLVPAGTDGSRVLCACPVYSTRAEPALILGPLASGPRLPGTLLAGRVIARTLEEVLPARRARVGLDTRRERVGLDTGWYGNKKKMYHGSLALTSSYSTPQARGSFHSNPQMEHTSVADVEGIFRILSCARVWSAHVATSCWYALMSLIGFRKASFFARLMRRPDESPMSVERTSSVEPSAACSRDSASFSQIAFASSPW